MPYEEISQLPPAVRRLPVLGQRMWLRVFNRVNKTQPEARAFSAAWSVLFQFYKKNKKGNWVKKK